jgi:uncharacterized protein YggE
MMNAQRPDSITVLATRSKELPADKVDLIVTTKGSSLVTGRDVLKHARDVAQQFSALHHHGIREKDLSVEGIFGDELTGNIGRNSATNYLVRIRCTNLDLLPDVLGIITPQRHARISSVQWHCSTEAKRRDACLKACVLEARRKGELIADSLGTNLLGLLSLSERWEDSDAQTPSQPISQKQLTLREQSAMPGFPLFHSKMLTLTLKAVFRISAFAE